MAGSKFTRESARRIARTVRRDEGTQQSSSPAPRGQVAFAPWDTIIFGKTDASHAKFASGTISVYDNVTDTGVNITAYNRFGDIATTKYVACWSAPWGWEIIAAEC